MSSSQITARILIALIVVTIGSIFFGAAWTALITGLLAIFAGLWWVGSMEKEGKFS